MEDNCIAHEIESGQDLSLPGLEVAQVENVEDELTWSVTSGYPTVLYQPYDNADQVFVLKIVSNSSLTRWRNKLARFSPEFFFTLV